MKSPDILRGSIDTDVPPRYDSAVGNNSTTGVHDDAPFLLRSIQRTTPNNAQGRLDLEIPSEIQDLEELWQEIEQGLGEKDLEHSNPTRTDCHTPINIPRMNILMLVVGSRGDVQPFLALALALKLYGHRVRIATHTCFRAPVEDRDIEFFDLGGDPKELMAYMVKNPGLVPGFDTIRSGEVQSRRRGMKNIVDKCWHACFETSYQEEPKQSQTKQQAGARSRRVRPEPFVADCVVANPPSMGHIHCAENLGIPLHIFFTMPWSPTSKVPHPLANVKTTSQQAGRTNLLSYLLVESVIWQGLGDILNSFRYDTLNLDPIHPSKGPLMLQYLRIPHTYCWSPALLPQPSEWRSNLAVTGYVFLDNPSSYAPPSELQRFLNDGPPPVYVGFGSIVVDDPAGLNNIILQAVKATGQRLILSTGWNDSDQAIRALGMVTNEVLVLRGDCPHDWLFPYMACVVHHGGAGTTAAALRAGRPTVTVPFFGDQFFWGDVVHSSGAGPKPIPYQSLDVAKLTTALGEAMLPGTIARANMLSEQIKSENGVQRALEHFHESLPHDRLACSLLPTHAAVWRIKKSQILLSALSATTLRKEGLIKWNNLELHRTADYTTAQGPYEPISGAAWAVTQLIVDGFRGMGEMIFEIGYFPVACQRIVHKSWSRMTTRRAITNDQQNVSEKHDFDENSPTYWAPAEQKPIEEKSYSGPGKYMIGGAARILKAAARAPGAFTSAMAQGSHNLPHLWNDRTVRPSAKVTGFRSGMTSGCKELALGVYDGTSGLFVQPILGFMQEGPVGFLKGTAKGVLGFPIKYFAAANAIVGHPLKGIDIAASRALKTDGMKAVQRERMLQGEHEYTTAGDELREQVLLQWQLLNQDPR